MSYTQSGLWVPSKADFTDGPVGATLTDTRGGINLVSTAQNAHKGMYKAVPTAPYTVTAKLDYNGATAQSDVVFYGIGFSDGTKVQTFLLNPNGFGTPGTVRVAVLNYSSYAAFDSFASTAVNVPWLAQGMWLQMSDDNTGSATSRSYRVSRDGVNFQTVFQVISSNYLTPTRVHFWTHDNTHSLNVTLTHWRIT
jgi:hypothetical protein